MRSKTWDASNGRVSPPSPPGANGKKQAASYAPKKDRESFRRALVSIIRYRLQTHDKLTNLKLQEIYNFGIYKPSSF